MIGGAQRRVKFNRISRRVRGKEEVKNVGPVSKRIGDTSRVLNQLFHVIEESKVEGLFTRLVSE